MRVDTAITDKGVTAKNEFDKNDLLHLLQDITPAGATVRCKLFAVESLDVGCEIMIWNDTACVVLNSGKLLQDPEYASVI